MGESPQTSSRRIIRGLGLIATAVSLRVWRKKTCARYVSVSTPPLRPPRQRSQRLQHPPRAQPAQHRRASPKAARSITLSRMATPAPASMAKPASLSTSCTPGTLPSGLNVTTSGWATPIAFPVRRRRLRALLQSRLPQHRSAVALRTTAPSIIPSRAVTAVRKFRIFSALISLRCIGGTQALVLTVRICGWIMAFVLAAVRTFNRQPCLFAKRLSLEKRRRQRS
jgi:hypothetical protein